MVFNITKKKISSNLKDNIYSCEYIARQLSKADNCKITYT